MIPAKVPTAWANIGLLIKNEEENPAILPAMQPLITSLTWILKFHIIEIAIETSRDEAAEWKIL